MSSISTPSARTSNAYSGPLQTVLAALAVCVLYWAVGLNETPASADTHVTHLQQVANTTSVGAGAHAAGQAR